MIKLHFPPITFRAAVSWTIGQGSVTDRVHLGNHRSGFHDVTRLHLLCILVLSRWRCKHSRMIIEMRTYKTKPGMRAEFLKIFKSKTVPEHQKIGMKILGPFLSAEDHDTFFFMRAFPDLESREPLKAQFYEGKLWKEELGQKLMPMIEKYDVLLVDAPTGLGDC